MSLFGPTFAAMAWKIGLTSGQAASLPPGIMLGPFRAPSSPPETPVPTYSSPFDSTYLVRRSVSLKSVLPPSMITSPGCKSGMSFSMNSSTAGPALTISITFRGVARLPTSSSSEWQPTKFFALGPPGQQVVNFACGAVIDRDLETPALDVQGQFSPITASPISPMSQFGVMLITSVI